MIRRPQVIRLHSRILNVISPAKNSAKNSSFAAKFENVGGMRQIFDDSDFVERVQPVIEIDILKIGVHIEDKVSKRREERPCVRFRMCTNVDFSSQEMSHDCSQKKRRVYVYVKCLGREKMY